MTVHDAILDEIRRQLLPSKPVEYASRELQLELQDRLQRSETSMIVGGRIPQKTIVRETDSFSQTFLTIDFGGSTLKFALITMPSCKILLREGFDIPAQLIDRNFFDTIVKRISIKINNHLAGKSEEAKFRVAITFSFPLNEKLEIITIGKGFELSPKILNTSVKDIISLSFDRVLSGLADRRFDVEICDVVNDSIAVYLTSKFMCKNESLSLILGTGVNSCFQMSLESVPSNKQPHQTEYNWDCLINVEAGFLGKEIIHITKFDHHDGGNSMPLEEICSGKWLPLTFSNILKEFRIGGLEHDTIDGELLVRIAEGKYEGADEDTLVLIREISKLLIQRGAFYVSAMLLAIGSFVNNETHEDPTGREPIDVGYVGSFLENSTYYKDQISLLSNNRIRLQFLHDSNLIGAAIATFLGRCH